MTTLRRAPPKAGGDSDPNTKNLPSEAPTVVVSGTLALLFPYRGSEWWEKVFSHEGQRDDAFRASDIVSISPRFRDVIDSFRQKIIRKCTAGDPLVLY